MASTEQVNEIKAMAHFLIASIVKHEKKYGKLNTEALRVLMIQAIMTTEDTLINAFGILDIAKMKYWDGLREDRSTENELVKLSQLVKSGKITKPNINIITNIDLEEVEKRMSPEVRKALKDILDNAKKVNITKLDDEGKKDEN